MLIMMMMATVMPTGIGKVMIWRYGSYDDNNLGVGLHLYLNITN
jgi:hypothetical protein